MNCRIRWSRFDAVQPRSPIAGLRGTGRGKGLVRVLLLLVAAAAVAAAASALRAIPAERVMAVPERRAAAEAIMKRLVELRARCQRQTSSIVTPMGDEMFYRYQQSLIDEAATTLGGLLQRSSTT